MVLLRAESDHVALAVSELDEKNDWFREQGPNVRLWKDIKIRGWDCEIKTHLQVG